MAEEDSMLQCLKLLVLNPYNGMPDTDITMDLSPGATVLDLKKVLEREYSTKPDPASQRIIYFGKLLRDEALLCDVFAKANLEEVQKVHLLAPAASSISPAAAPTQGQTALSAGSQPSNEDDQNRGRTNLGAALESGFGGVSGQQEFTSTPDVPPRSVDQSHSREHESEPERQSHAQTPAQPVHQTMPTFAANRANVSQEFHDIYQTYLQDQASRMTNLREQHAPSSPHPSHIAQLNTDALSSFGTTRSMAAVGRYQESLNDSEIEEHMRAPWFTHRYASSSRKAETETVASHSSPRSASALGGGLSAVTEHNDDKLEETSNPEDLPRTAEECLADLESHYQKLMDAIELSHRVQASAAALMSERMWQVNVPMWANQTPPLTSRTVTANHIAPEEQLGRWLDEGEPRHQPQPQPQPQPLRPEPQQPPLPQVGRRGGAAGIVVINVRLIIKLIMALYFFTGDTSTNEFYGLICLAVVYYLYDTGHLAWLVGTPESHMRFLEERGLNAGGAIATVEQEGPGLYTDTYYLLKSFFLSTIPVWRVRARTVNPQAHPNDVQPPAPPQVAPG
eukprot:CAMPEP_0184532960 /NCGR_PEP_ID=MMETSP0198_2-20121128/14469_1 /TAXON_ID=1112570 /ORGANISM="Thraustochytrium sp., Strain LLF1b" /LENGTH=565 /DNA_ID=CAMNT_0026925639 /DNA_START=305 /DNA_END=2002 /DNA_ORIENTATION=+